MKKIASIIVATVALVTMNGCGESVVAKIASALTNSYFYNDTNTTIPDNGSVISDLEVNSTITSLTKLKVSVDINHTNAGDLRLYIKSPQNTLIKLSKNRGAGSNGFSVTFDDEADYSITNYSIPVSGIYSPEENLSKLNGENPNGTWQLLVRDTSVGDVGFIKMWALMINWK